MASVSQHSEDRRVFSETAMPVDLPIYKSNPSATRVDIALVASALFLQRFSLPFGKMRFGLDLVAVTFILLHQFFSGKLLMQYDRFVWLLAVGLAVTFSSLLNLAGISFTSYLLFMVLCWAMTLTRPSTFDCYRNTLLGFQTVVIILSCIAVAQFAAQFVVDGRQLIMFYGVVPDFLLGPSWEEGGAHTIHEIEALPSLLKSNGVFLSEPANFSQVTAFAILIEILEFRRPLYLCVILLAHLLAYSGTGLMIILAFLPIAGIRHAKAGLSAMLAGILGLGLVATGIVDLSAFVYRASELQNPGASGHYRFIAPFWMAAKFFDTASLQTLLIGSGPGTAKTYSDTWYGAAMSGWLKLLYEYGVFGSLIFACFWASCLRRSACSGVVLAALIFTAVFDEGFLSPWFSTILIVLCTLHGLNLGAGQVDRQISTVSTVAAAD